MGVQKAPTVKEFLWQDERRKHLIKGLMESMEQVLFFLGGALSVMWG